jgi:UPF0755 protein
MKKIFSIVALLILIFIIAAWLILSSGTAFKEKEKYFVIEEGKTDKENVLKTLESKYIVNHTSIFSLLASQMNVWNKIKPGKYVVKHGESILNIARMLKNGKQAQINLVINKLRLKEDLAKLISKNFSIDSSSIMAFITSNDSLKQYHVDSNTVFTMIIPDTYTFYWNVSLRKIFNRLYEAENNFWEKNNRTEKASTLGFTPKQIYILSSIVEEESNFDDDKAKIASVYINRFNKNMALQACPSIKYVMRNFSLPRIYDKYLRIPSPYNTYINKGLPPGPICTPSIKTIDIVLNSPKTDYLFFVATADFSGRSHFSNNYAEHEEYAKQYQKALDERMAEKQETINKQPQNSNEF